mmetsp:Transcript_4118/g.8905  ORF Transcript_4118/g.8905 Transcript_4118/m.8905 type:complete len:350 (-) Transcript_4118:187-1236(-)|eukprot:CAMPEP_0171488990 /NCGR_PEP_ID=MMETSP0958-20121227/2507_1 /TAXON_ID=87120 /ORGANISM="Aurantiochytrium limacinum, Strain ATCCMYA-1381" /LENGTH=349 /DNA_ID=CAMNT_0012022151 /DNA_START=232 /DNA_END=1281 /DNA_ORIENTATION=-
MSVPFSLEQDALMAAHNETFGWGESFVKSIISGQAMPSPTSQQLANLPQWNWPWVLFAEMVVVHFIVNWIIRLGIAMPLARALLKSRARRPEKVGYLKVDKFAQSTMEMIWYASYFVLGLRLISEQPWVWPSRFWWVDQPNNRAITQDVAFFYVCYAARYGAGLMTVFLETKRKDFMEMVIHHSVTVVLVYLSFQYGMVRVGCVIMVLLDVADVPLHIAKQCSYTNEIGSKSLWGLAADFFFVCFAVAFIVTRMVLYPYVVWSCFQELWLEFAPGKNFVDVYKSYFDYVPPMVFGCQSLVVVLQILQIFWFMLLLKAIVKVLGGGPLKDNRSDSESGVDTDNEETKKTK